MPIGREANIRKHRWYQKRFHVRLTRDEASRDWIFPAGVERINEHIGDRGYLAVNGLSPAAAYISEWGVWQDEYRDYEVDGLRPVLIADFTNNKQASVI